jgi:hypothetical protein
MAHVEKRRVDEGKRSLVMLASLLPKLFSKWCSQLQAAAIDYPVQLPLRALKLDSLEIVERIEILDPLVIALDVVSRLAWVTIGGLTFRERLEKVESRSDLETLIDLSGFTQLPCVARQKQGR